MISITSCKGGVGKSTITAHLAMALALQGAKTLVVDCDFGIRCLDLIMGYENEIVYDIYDVVKKRVSYEKALLRDWRCENLFFCAAPVQYEDDLEVPEFQKAIHQIASSMQFDYILMDTPGGIGAPFLLAACAASSALVVTSHPPAALRAAEKTAALLTELGISSQHMIINFFDAKAVLQGLRPSILEMIDTACIPLIGVVPYAPELVQAQETGTLVNQLKKSNVTTAFYNIANRIHGENIPLLSGFRGIRRLLLLK